MDWTLAGSVIFTGITVVFSVLVILMICIAALGKFGSISPNKEKAAPAPAPVAAAPAPNTVSDEEVAVITAAVASVIGSQNFSIHEIKRVSQ
jgi:sodium pump decarboxylase gamma subunit